MRKLIILGLTAFGLVAATIPANAVTYCISLYGKAVYEPSGRYTYTNRAGTSVGTWKGSPGKGTVTVKFTNGNSRTDTYKVMGGALYLVNSDGVASPAHLPSLKRPC